MMRRLCALILGLSAAAAGMAHAQPSVDHSAVPVVRFRNGDSSFAMFTGISDSVRTVVRDPAEWRTLWTRINRPFLPQPALPEIDFRREMVVVAGLGRRANAGYDILIESVEQDSAGIEVALRLTSPAPGCPVAAVITQPLDVARIPASELRVRFRERSVVIPCSGR